MSRLGQLLSASRLRCYQRFLYLAIFSAGVASSAGCGSSAVPDKKPTFLVTGSVFGSGKPLVGALVTLHPMDATSSLESWADGFPRATVQADGKFVTSTYADSDGAPAGNYVVLIRLLAPCVVPPDDDPDADSDDEQKPTPTMCDKFQGQYTEPNTSTWKVKVESQPLEIPRIDIK